MSNLDLGAKYQVLEAVGKDQTGTLYKARQILLDRVVAVKVINPTLLSTPEAMSHFVREVKRAAELNHPNIVRVHDIDKTVINGKSTIFIVNEFVSGLTLEQYLQKSPTPSLSEILRIGGELCQGLAFGHKVGLSHQNINLSTVLLSGGRQVKIADFGIASGVSAGATGKDSPLIGKPGYLSPEQIKRQIGTALTPAVDIYAVGTILYQMVTGVAPFAGPTPMDILTKQFKGTLEKPSLSNPQLPPLLEQVILATLNKVPGDRPASAAHLFAYLDKVFRENCERKMVLESSGEVRVDAVAQMSPAPAAPVVQKQQAPQTVKADRKAVIGPPPTQAAKQGVTQQLAPAQPQATQRVVPAQPQATQQVAAPPLQRQPETVKTPSEEHIDASMPQHHRRPFIRKVAYAGMAASLVSMIIVALFGFDVSSLKLFPEEKAKKKDIQGIAIERPQRQLVQVSWMSKEAYMGQIVLAKKTKQSSSAVTSRRVVAETKGAKEHRLVYQGLKPHEDYTLIVENAETGEELHRASVSGRARLVSGPFVYPRRCSADIDWVSDVRLSNPRVLIRTEESLTASTDRVEVKARQTQLENKTYRYTATFVKGDPEPVYAEIAGMQEEESQNIRVLLEAEIVAETSPEVRPMFSLATNRYILDGLARQNSSYARQVRQMLPRWARRELLKERRNHYANFVGGPIVVEDQLIVGDQAGTIYSFLLTGDEAFKSQRSSLDLAWAYFDGVANYDSVWTLTHDGTHLIAQLMRARLEPTEIQAREKEVREDYKKRARILMAEFVGKKGEGKNDELVFLNIKERKDDWAIRAKGAMLADMAKEETAQKVQPKWGEKVFPLRVTHSQKKRSEVTGLNLPLKWCMSGDKKQIAATMRSSWLKKNQAVMRTYSVEKPEAPWALGVDKLATIEAPPVCHEDVVYTRSMTREVEDLSELEKHTPGFVTAYDLQSKRQWRFSTTGTLQFTHFFFDDYRHRVYFSDHENVYSLDHGLRTKMLRDGEEIPNGLLESTNEFIIPVSRIRTLLPPKERIQGFVGRGTKKTKRYILATPVIFAPRRWKGQRELILLCLNSPPENQDNLTVGIRAGHVGASLYMFDLSGDSLRRYVPFVARGHRDYCRITAGMPPDAMCHFVQRGENGAYLFSLLGRTFVFDLNEEPTVDRLSGMQRHIIVDHAPLGSRVRRMLLHRSAVYSSDLGGRLLRFAFSPTRLPRPRKREPLPIDHGMKEDPGRYKRMRSEGQQRRNQRDKRERRRREEFDAPPDGPPDGQFGGPPDGQFDGPPDEDRSR